MADDMGGRDGSHGPRKSGWMTAASVGSLGIEMGLSVAIGYFLGSWLDGRFGTQPWLTILFLLCGIAAAFLAIFRIAGEARRAMQAKDEDERDQRDH